MNECTACNLCENPGTLAKAAEVRQVPCHVRKFRNQYFTVWRCSNCDSLHSKEVVDLPYFYEHYPFKNHTLDFHTRIGYGNRLKLLKAQGYRPGQSLLDFGCGQGLFVQYLREEGFSNVTGYDPFVKDFSTSSTLKKQYDVVTSYDVIEHVEQPREFFEQMLKLVRPGGLLVLGTPNASELDLGYETTSPVELSQPYHRHILSEKILFSMAKKFGLTPIHTHRRFYFDTFIPTVNTSFMWKYVELTGGLIDVCVEPPRWGFVLRHPQLVFLALFGRLFRCPGNILVTFRAAESKSEPLLDDFPQRAAGIS